MQKIIVTGGMGYIGSHTVIELINHGFEPIILDNLSNASIEVLDGIKKITGAKVKFENIELTDSDATSKILNKHKDSIGVIHFAALKAVGESVEKPLLYYKNNIFSLVNILDAAKANKIPHFIFSSSCTVYGQPDVLPVTEATPIKPAASPYGNTKQVGEEILEAAMSKDQETHSCISLRYFNPVGAHNSAEIGELPLGVPNNLMPYITQTAAGVRDQLSVFGDDYNTPDGTAIRDYIHVVDLAEAHVIALKRLIEKENTRPYEVYNLGTGKGHSVMEVIKSFEKSTGIKLNFKKVARRAGDIQSIFADTQKASEKLKWQTRYSLDDMTSSAWAWEKKLRNISK